MMSRRVSALWVSGVAVASILAACTVNTSNDDDDDDDPSGEGGETSMAGRPAGGSGAGAGTNEGGAGGDPGTGPVGGGGTTGEGGAGGGEAGGTGTGEAGAGGGGGTVVSGDSCEGGEETPNETRDTATPYTLGTSYTACVQNADDIDYYEFTTPADGDGGYVVISVTDVGETGSTAVEVWAAANNGEIARSYNTSDGGSTYLYFNAEPGATFRVPVTPWNAQEPTEYTFRATFTPVVDEYEPNDRRADAAPITVGTPVEAYMFAGWETSTGIPDEAWSDWYAVALEAGAVNMLLSLSASDVDGSITVYNPLGSQVAREYDTTDGSSVVLDYTVPSAGTYYVNVSYFTQPTSRSEAVEVPQYLTEPYTFTVEQ